MVPTFFVRASYFIMEDLADHRFLFPVPGTIFEERYNAYLAGREPADPSVDWYESELWFFDNYIIPLANKLEHCGVFGVSSAESLCWRKSS
jgi:hypothetical protein